MEISLPAPIAFLLAAVLPMLMVGAAICITWDTFFFSRTSNLWRLRDDLADEIRKGSFADDAPAIGLLRYIESARDQAARKGPFSIALMRLIAAFGDPYQNRHSRPTDFLDACDEDTERAALLVFVRRFEDVWVRSSIWRALPAEWVLNSIDWFSSPTKKQTEPAAI